MAILINQDVFWFKISIYNVIFMQMFDSQEDFSCEALYDSITEFFLLSKMKK